jgi:hypothetical protein
MSDVGLQQVLLISEPNCIAGCAMAQQLVTSLSPWRPWSNRVQSMLDLRWNEWNRDRLFSEYFSFLLPVALYQHFMVNHSSNPDTM